MPSSITTAIGLAKFNNASPENQVRITHIAVGDGVLDLIDETSSDLINEVFRGECSVPYVSQEEPKILSWDLQIPDTVGGFTIREAALIDEDGDVLQLSVTDPIVVPAPEDLVGAVYTITLSRVLTNSNQEVIFDFTAGNPVRADKVLTSKGGSVQDFVDSFALKIFQSPTDGGLTEIQTRTINGGEVYEVRKVSDDSLATIYSDAAGTTEIVQNGTANKSGSDGVVEFYIADGDYYVLADSKTSNFNVVKNLFKNVVTDNAAKSLPVGKVSPPAKFNDQLSLVRYCDGKKVNPLVNPFDLIDFTKNTSGLNTYYINYTTGSDANDGLSSANSWKTLNYAVQNAVSPAEILIEDEWIGYQSLVDSTPTINGKIKLKSINDKGYTRFVGMRESYDQATFAFVDEGGGCWSTSAADTSSAIYSSLGIAMFDNNYQDSDGIAVPIINVSSAAECIATPGTQYDDSANSKRYIHLLDGRKPDPYNGWMYCQAGTYVNATQTADDGCFLIEDIKFYYNTKTAPLEAFRYRHQNASTPNNSQLGLRNSTFSGASANGLEVYDAKITVVDNCVSKYNRKDGFNYHSFVSSGNKGEYMTVYEINCVSSENGYDGFYEQAALGQSENATTAHNSIHIERFNGIYGGCKGATVADVNGTVSVLWCCDAGKSVRDTVYNYIYWHDNYLAAGAENGMWLWGCSANPDGDADVITLSTEPQSGAVKGNIFIRNWVGEADVIFSDNISGY